MRKKIRTALIGAGNMGKNHARVYSEISDFIAIADVIPEIGQPLALQYNVPYYKDFKAMIETEKPDAVSVVVPTRFHKDVTIACLEKKVPTLVEKPIANTPTEAEEMISVAKKNKIFLMVGHVERFNPAVITLKEMVEKGRLGKIINLLAIRVGIAPPKIPHSDVALDLGIHDVDVFNYLLNEFPVNKTIIKKKLFAANDADTASILIEYKEAQGMIQTNWITPIKMRSLYVTGTEGFAELDYINQRLILYDTILEKKQIGDFFEVVSMSQALKKDVFVSKKEPLKEELRFFLSHLDNQVTDSNAYSSLKALELFC